MVTLHEGKQFIINNDHIASAEEGSGVLVNWDGKIVGVIQSECEVNAQKNTIEPIYLTLQAGGSTCPDTPHEGEEFGYVLQGAVSIHLGNKTYKAKKGESFYYTADKTHFLSSKNGATLIWVSSPPSF